MRIKLDFYEAAKHTFENPENLIKRDNNGDLYCTNTDKLFEIGKELEKVICEDYFNGADNACIFVCYNYVDSYFEFVLIPNI